MSTRPEIKILFLDEDHLQSAAASLNPRKCIIKSGFGAMQRRCWLELYNEDLHLPVRVGGTLEVWINQARCFRGKIQQRRIDSIDDYQSLFALFDPEVEFNQLVYRAFENRTVTEILDSLLLSVGLQHDSFPQNDTRFQRLEFSNDSLFFVLDLLAKLAGNWRWDIQDDGLVLFRPYSPVPDHTLALLRDVDSVNVWETLDDLYTWVELEGGVLGGATYDHLIEIPNSAGNPGKKFTKIFVRSIASMDTFQALQRAIIHQMENTHFEHYIDLNGRFENILPGDTVHFQVDQLPLFPHEQIFRVKEREIVYAHETIRTRFHLTSGFESSPTYFYYLRQDRSEKRLFLKGQIGPFQLDVSALDSSAHLDSSDTV